MNYDGPAVAAITLDGSEQYGGNRDFLLKYRLAGGKIETGLLLFEGDEENFFLLMVQPPERVSDVQIPAREYIFIVDVSGSMRGFPLKISKKLLRDLIGRLRPTDRFNVLLFAGGSSVMSSQSVSATPENIRHAIDLIERQRGGGGTELLPALKRALSLPKHEGFSRTVVIATDGYVTVEKEAFDLIRNNLGSANMFPFGIGSSVNRHLIEGMARVGMGEPFVITKPDEASHKANTFRKLIESPVLTGIKLEFGEFQTHHVEPPSIPDVLADRPVIVFGKWRGKAEGCIHLSGITGNRSFAGKIDVAGVEPLETNSALRYLWARHRIAILADYNRLNPQDERVREVTTLGLSYNLLTAYTSFVAIDSQVRLRDGQAVRVKQPLPLPEGVSDYAVGNGGLVQKTLASAAFAPSVRGEKVIMEEEPCEVEADHRVDRVSQEESNAKESHIELREITVTGGLPKESVRRLIEEHMASLSGCYKLASGEQSGPKGKIVLTLTIDQKGRVIMVHPDRNHPTNRRLGECIVGELKKVLFPAPEGGKTAVVTLVFVIK
jgi:Ca-activated chloride channel family protein